MISLITNQKLIDKQNEQKKITEKHMHSYAHTFTRCNQFTHPPLKSI